MAVQISITDLRGKIDAGWKKKQLAKYYGLPVTQMTKLLQQAGLRIKKLHYPKFELIDDTPNGTIVHQITQEDMNMNPEFIENGIQVGDIISMDEEEVDGELVETEEDWN